jgi:hypothetical protein
LAHTAARSSERLPNITFFHFPPLQLFAYPIMCNTTTKNKITTHYEDPSHAYV